MGFFDIFFSKSQVRTSGKNPEGFDFKKEKQLMKQYIPHIGKRDSHEYFAAMPFIEFYYKFRNLDEKYLERCIKYCNICISCLDSRDMKKEIKDGITIPAFKRLIIIYEKKNDYKKAGEIAGLAMNYTNSNNKEDAEYYSKKMSENINRQLKS